MIFKVQNQFPTISIYEEMDGWEEDISEIRSFELLPQNAQKYVLRLEQLLKKPILYIGVGPENNATICRSQE